MRDKIAEDIKKALKNSDIELFKHLESNKLSDKEYSLNASLIFNYLNSKDNDSNEDILIFTVDNGRLNYSVQPRSKVGRNTEKSSQIKLNYLMGYDNESNYLLDINKVDKNENRKEILFELASLKKYMEGKTKSYFNIWLWGSFGLGKTHIVKSFSNKISANNFKIAFIYIPDLKNLLYDMTGNNEKNINLVNLVNKMKQCDLLVLDDLGSENLTPFMRDSVYLPVINFRNEKMKPIIVTSNYNLNGYNKFVIHSNSNERIPSQRLIERLKENTKVINIKGRNRRN